MEQPERTQKVKILKCTLVQALSLCTVRTAHRGSRGIALLFHDHGTRRGWVVSVTPRPLFTPGKDPVPIVQEAGWAPRPVWTVAENLADTGIRSPDRPARSQSLNRLSYPGPQKRHRWQYKTAYSLWIMGNEDYKHTLRMCNSYWFSAAPIITRTRLLTSRLPTLPLRLILKSVELN